VTAFANVEGPALSARPALQDEENEPPPDTAEDENEGQDATPEPTATPTVVPGSLHVTAASFPFGFLASDTELVYGPTLYSFDTVEFVDGKAGYLSRVLEPYGGRVLRGPELVEAIAVQHSIGPRVLLALIEATSGWVTNAAPADTNHPLGGDDVGLGPSLLAAAEALNGAFYGRKQSNQIQFPLADGSVVALPSTNAGTFAVAAFFGSRTEPADWAGLEWPSRFALAWERLFGPAGSYDTLFTRPAISAGPRLALPFPAGELWYYVGGPAPPYTSGEPWSEVRFAPPPAWVQDCTLSPFWVLAAAGGKVVASSAESLVIDTDQDGFLGSGWVHVYAHLSDIDRAGVGRSVRRGDRIGHASCEGGGEAPAHVGFARRFEGEWIGASDSRAPMVLSGWIPFPDREPGAGVLSPGSSGSELPARIPGPKNDAANGVLVRP
jgi:hypothetical protein